MSLDPRSQGQMEVRAEHSDLARNVLLPLKEYFYSEVTEGTVLIASAIIALIWINSPWGDSYLALQQATLAINTPWFTVSKSLQHWINDGLMTVFFFSVGLEIKRELVKGDLASWQQAALPAIAAIGGMAVPAGLYLLMNMGDAGSTGFGITVATDIAFALALLAMVGRGIPAQARTFLLAFAVADDIGGVLLIALFYAHDINPMMLGIAGAIVGIVLTMQYLRVRYIPAYVVVGVVLWFIILKSGVHATIAGVLLGLLTPARSDIHHTELPDELDKVLTKYRDAEERDEPEEADQLLGEMEELAVRSESPVERLERSVAMWVGYIVLPLFGLANAGIKLTGGVLAEAITSPVTQGTVVGLVVGKLIGITGFTWGASKIGIGALPKGIGMRHVIGLGLMAGMGFTVSLFIADIAFRDYDGLAQAKIGVLAASLVAATLGFLFMRAIAARKK